MYGKLRWEWQVRYLVLYVLGFFGGICGGEKGCGVWCVVKIEGFEHDVCVNGGGREEARENLGGNLVTTPWNCPKGLVGLSQMIVNRGI